MYVYMYVLYIIFLDLKSSVIPYSYYKNKYYIYFHITLIYFIFSMCKFLSKKNHRNIKLTGY